MSGERDFFCFLKYSAVLVLQKEFEFQQTKRTYKVLCIVVLHSRHTQNSDRKALCHHEMRKNQISQHERFWNIASYQKVFWIFLALFAVEVTWLYDTNLREQIRKSTVVELFWECYAALYNNMARATIHIRNLFSYFFTCLKNSYFELIDCTIYIYTTVPYFFIFIWLSACPSQAIDNFLH